ncbi:MAG: ATP-dependent 6-phosphofructokinase [Holosporales bacterium]|jgi:6-phosphofructokinase 1|nr:ATP-dependent 6-phosphofructokinase [Holosporales bacterium]
MKSKKKIGIMTVGGDCSGLNSVIRAAVIRSKIMGHDIVGIRRGFSGLFPHNSDHISLGFDHCGEEMLTVSGSILYSDTKSFTSSLKNGKSTDEVMRMVFEGYNKLSLDGLIYIGGDGSLTILRELLSVHRDLRIVAVPKTIDNDVNITDLSIGFSTAVEVVSNAINNIRTTARSHERTMVIEVMGRDAGFIAMYAGIASGADIILVPEFKYNFSKVVSKVQEVYRSGKDHCIILVAEAVESDELRHCSDPVLPDTSIEYASIKYKGIGQHISDLLQKSGIRHLSKPSESELLEGKTARKSAVYSSVHEESSTGLTHQEADYEELGKGAIESRAVVLGHIQRGGNTAVLDRIVGTAFGVEAVNAISDEDYGIMLCYINGRVKRVPISDIMKDIHKRLDPSDICVKMAMDLGVYIGEV